MDSQVAIRLFLAKQQILDDWEVRVLNDDRIPTARTLEPFRLRDYVPRFVDMTSEALAGDGYRGDVRAKGTQFGRVHAVERLDAGFKLEEVLCELEHLRLTLCGHLANSAEAQHQMCEAIKDAIAIAEGVYAESGPRLRAHATTLPSAGGHDIGLRETTKKVG